MKFTDQLRLLTTISSLAGDYVEVEDRGESGVFDADGPVDQHGVRPPSGTSSPQVPPKAGSNYDYPPPRTASQRRDDNDDEEDKRPVIPKKKNPPRKYSLPTLDCDVIPEDAVSPPIYERSVIIQSKEHSDIMNDDGTFHTYMNQTRHSSANEADADCMDRLHKSPSLPVDYRTVTLQRSEDYRAFSPPLPMRSRSQTLPELEKDEHHCPRSPRREETIKDRPLPMPQVHRSKDFE